MTVLMKATQNDLSELNDMYRKVVARMFENGIDLWNDFYPTDEFPADIANGQLYVLRRNKKIIAAFGVFDSVMGQDCFEWKDKNAKAVYIGRLGVHPDYARQGLGGKVLAVATEIARTKNADYLRLVVAIENTPAMGLYRKNGFEQVSGKTVQFFDSLKRNVTEFGFEKEVK